MSEPGRNKSFDQVMRLLSRSCSKVYVSLQNDLPQANSQDEWLCDSWRCSCSTFRGVPPEGSRGSQAISLQVSSIHSPWKLSVVNKAAAGVYPSSLNRSVWRLGLLVLGLRLELHGFRCVKVFTKTEVQECPWVHVCTCLRFDANYTFSSLT